MFHTIDIIMCALGFYALGFFFASLIWAVIKWCLHLKTTEMWWRRLYLISCFSWLAVVSFILVGLEIVLLGIGMTIEEKVKGTQGEEETRDENVN